LRRFFQLQVKNSPLFPGAILQGRASNPEEIHSLGFGWVHVHAQRSMVKAARFIVLATAIERNISSYFWLSTCGAANLELSAFGGLRMLFCLSRRKKWGLAGMMGLQVHRVQGGHKANTFSLLNCAPRSGLLIRCQKLPVPAVDGA